MTRVGVFIDWQNLQNGIRKDYRGFGLDFKTFRDYLDRLGHIVFCGAYLMDYAEPETDQADRVDRIVGSLEQHRFRVRRKAPSPVYERGEAVDMKGSCIPDMITEAALLAGERRFDELVLVSGNRDFVPLVARLSDVPYLIPTRVISHQLQTAQALREAAAVFTPFKEIARYVLRGLPGGGGRQEVNGDTVE